MSLTRPLLISTPSFDATKEKTFVFNVSAGGSQIVANKLIIRKQSDNEIVYQEKQTTFKYEHILPADTLSNGEYYNAVIIVFDNQGNESVPSLPIQFRCYTTPILKFLNFPETAIINNASYNFSFEYSQVEGERLNSYVVNLYDVFHSLISTSSNVYVQGSPPYNASYLFTGFIDDTAYYVEVVGTTINGAIVSTGKHLFNVDYKQPDLFTLLELENNCDEGYITVSSNIILIDGEYQPDPPIFINDKEIDLTGKDSYIRWPDGYNINDDFLMRAWFRKPNDYSDIIMFSNVSGQTIRITFMKGYEDVNADTMKAYVKVNVISLNNMEYYIYSNYITPLEDSQYYNLQLRKLNGVYEVKLIDMSKEGI